MRKFSRIVENKEFGGRKDIWETLTNVVGFIDEVNSGVTKQNFFIVTLVHAIEEKGIDPDENYWEDYNEGTLGEICNSRSEETDYSAFREYVYNNYSVDLDDVDSVYLDALWLIYSLRKNMGHKFKQINTNRIKQ